MANELKINQLFDEYDNSESLPKGYSNDQLAVIARDLSLASTAEQKNSVRDKTPSKVKAIVKIVNAVSFDLNLKLKAIGSKYKLQVNKKTTYSAKDEFGKIDISYSNNTVNFNIKKLSKLPPLEVYACITKGLYDIVKADLEKIGEYDKNSELDEQFNNETEYAKKGEQNKYNKAKKVLAGYLEKFIEREFPFDFKRYSNIANFIAGQILEGFDENDYDQILDKFFDFESVEKIAKREVKDFLGESTCARISRLSGRATELLFGKTDKDGNFIPSKADELESLKYHEQANELLSSSLLSKFKKIDRNGNFEYSSEIKSFCKDFAEKFMHSNGLQTLPVTFESTGDYGVYRLNHSFNIDLQLLNKTRNLTELVLTLTHELTHARDSAINMAKGNFNSRSGGLHNVFDVDEIKRARDFAVDGDKEFIEELKSYCYHIDPNERNARINELAGLKFMKNFASDDPMVMAEVNYSTERFIIYQQNTRDYITGNEEKNIPPLADKIKEFEAKFDAASGLNAEAKKIVLNAINYLKHRLSDPSFTLIDQEEKESILEAQKLLKEETMVKQVEKQTKEREM